MCLQVVFVGEKGEDTGGLRREFWRLFGLGVTKEYCVGDSSCMTFRQNVSALQVIYIHNACKQT